MGREEQVEEREVLESIFPDEITGQLRLLHHKFLRLTSSDISETEFRISITLDIPDEENIDPPSFLLQVRYPDDYPDKAPHLDILASPNGPSHEHFNVSEDREQLLSSLEVTVEENLGIAVVFTLVSTLKENAEQLIQDRKDAANNVREEAMLEAERQENKKFHGTAVTPETFVKWREDFLKEMEEQRLKEEEERQAELKKARIKEPAKLTGRQLWEKGLAGKGGEGDEEEDGVPTEEIEQLKVEAS